MVDNEGQNYMVSDETEQKKQKIQLMNRNKRRFTKLASEIKRLFQLL